MERIRIRSYSLSGLRFGARRLQVLPLDQSCAAGWAGGEGGHSRDIYGKESRISDLCDCRLSLVFASERSRAQERLVAPLFSVRWDANVHHLQNPLLSFRWRCERSELDGESRRVSGRGGDYEYGSDYKSLHGYPRVLSVFAECCFGRAISQGMTPRTVRRCPTTRSFDMVVCCRERMPRSYG